MVFAWSLKHEKGTAAVGANSKYAQITKEEWAKTLEKLSRYEFKEVAPTLSTATSAQCKSARQILWRGVPTMEMRLNGNLWIRHPANQTFVVINPSGQVAESELSFADAERKLA